MTLKRALPAQLISIVLLTTVSTLTSPDAVFARPPRVRKAKVTFYCRSCDPSSRVADPRRRMSSPQGVAADPRYHPLGSLVYIEGYGTRRVDDTGGAIKGPHRFDIRLSSRGKCHRLGVKRLAYHVVKRAPKKKVRRR